MDAAHALSGWPVISERIISSSADVCNMLLLGGGSCARAGSPPSRRTEWSLAPGEVCAASASLADGPTLQGQFNAQYGPQSPKAASGDGFGLYACFAYLAGAQWSMSWH